MVIDLDPARVAEVSFPALTGDVTDDEMLRKAGIMRARALVTAINTDAENVYVTLSARALRPDPSSSPVPAPRRRSRNCCVRAQLES